jgi:beta-N-acetylhexosaminidase
MVLLACVLHTCSFANTIDIQHKIGQMIVVGFKATTLSSRDPIVKAILQKQIGGVILFDYYLPQKIRDCNIKSPDQLKHLTNQLQAYAKESGHVFPLLIGIDYEGGRVNRLKTEFGFPETISAQKMAQLNVEQVMQKASQMAKTLKKVGINLNFAPVLDLSINPDSPIISKLERAFSHDSNTVIQYAKIFVEAHRKEGILCAYKHFPGHGSALGDTHQGFVDVTYTWQPIELLPYKALLREINTLVMTAHVVNRTLDKSGYPATLSAPILTELLRKQLGFEGVIVSDCMQMDAIKKHYSLREAVIKAIHAGVDILVFSNQLVPYFQDPKEIIEIILSEIKAGHISEKRIDESYQRIQTLKQQLI